MSTAKFTSWLSPHLEGFLTLKRASGLGYKAEARVLQRFDRYLVEHRIGTPLTTKALQDYLTTLSYLFRRSRQNVVSVVWRGLTHARQHGAPIEDLPERPRNTPSSIRMREPFVLSHSQVDRLLRASRRLTPDLPHVQATHACLMGLLYSTGLRISEALNLDVGDLDRREETLIVRAGKFGKDRLVPVSSSTVAALVRYLALPQRPLPRGSDDPLFLSRQRGRLSYVAALMMLRRAAALAGLEEESDCRVRLHDLRHTFAVHRVLAWHQEGRDVNAMLPALSTYMGHVSPAHTYTYLRSADLLSREVARRFERSAKKALNGGVE
jgi:integrase